MSATPTLAELLIAFAFAGDLAVGLELDDGVRACYVADCIAEEMRLPLEQAHGLVAVEIHEVIRG